ncbi:MAG: hypothetical protein QOI13_328 [Paraburkholderia sp.]|nr:hypothetical protein [Paraburkholderia sp.]
MRRVTWLTWLTRRASWGLRSRVCRDEEQDEERADLMRGVAGVAVTTRRSEREGDNRAKSKKASFNGTASVKVAPMFP